MSVLVPNRQKAERVRKLREEVEEYLKFKPKSTQLALQKTNSQDESVEDYGSDYTGDANDAEEDSVLHDEVELEKHKTETVHSRKGSYNRTDSRVSSKMGSK